MKPMVAVVGRPNVGKSTLINRLAGARMAIVHDLPGVTRDRLYLDAHWIGHVFSVIDTGGIVPGDTDELLQSVAAQAQIAIEEADAILFVVDLHDGVTPIDIEIAQSLRQTKTPVFLVINKLDNPEEAWKASEFYELSLGDPYPISAMHGIGTGDLLDAVVATFPKQDEFVDPDVLKIAIVGRPNVGKSSICNSLLGEDRSIVSPISGTTRDAIDSMIKFNSKQYMLIDTAGIRRKSKVDYGVEQFAVVRALKAMERADVVVMVIDGTTGVTEQDQRIAGLADDEGKAVVVVVNKWDAVVKDEHTMVSYAEEVRKELHFIKYAQILFTSAITRKRLNMIFEAADSAAEENMRRIPTGLINQVLIEAMALNPPPTDKGRSAKMKYVPQATVKPPTFILFVNNPKLIRETYVRYLESKVRAAFGFVGTPLRMILRGREEK
ncbi:MAG: ribosome biogenesis GTPase Der [Candidatus Sericytochromatia bacterium]|nr:ribosome biogenesis GTPase Der [Candidatus Sericytochromatia bacterium]